MIAKEITGNIISQQYSDGKLNVSIAFDWFETDKKRMRKVAEDGTGWRCARRNRRQALFRTH